MMAYEMVYIVRPDLGEELVSQQITKYRDFLKEHGAENIQIKVWGKRRLAYPIQNFQDGIYVQMNYNANGQQIAPLERNMRLSEEIIRYLTIKLKDTRPVSNESDSFEESQAPPTPPTPHESQTTEQPQQVEPSIEQPQQVEPSIEQPQQVEPSIEQPEQVEPATEQPEQVKA